ncbi:hypothetical protein KCV06_g638, partial [Aureobasidium melanogenum]
MQIAESTSRVDTRSTRMQATSKVNHPCGRDYVSSKIHLVVAVHGAVQLAVRCLDVCPTDKQIWEHKPYRRRLR